MALNETPEPLDPGEQPELLLDDEETSAPPDRSRDLLGRRDSGCRKRLDKLFDRITKGFEDQASRSDDLDKWWNIYSCMLDAEQFYNGNAQVYVPIIRDAVNARATRFVNQLFPTSGRYLDCTTSDGSQPYEILALANHYIQQAKLKTQVIKPLLKCGDIEGQYNLYVDWDEVERQIVSREMHMPLVPMDDGYIEAGEDEIEDIDEEDVTEGHVGFEVLHDSDVLICPASADSVQHALNRGGCVVVVRRWSKERIDAMVEHGEIRKDEADALKDSVINDPKLPGFNDVARAIIKTIGIRSKGSHAIVLEVWTCLTLNESGTFSEKGKPRLCRAWMGINRQQLGCKRNPYWSDRCPLLSVPVEKVPGIAKGKSLVEPLAPLQYEANDAANERADADHYGAMPIIMRKPGEGNAPLILNLAAVWDTDPASTRFAEFPDLSMRARARVQDAMMIVNASLGVNPAMMPSSGRPGGKRNQAEMAMEAQVDLLTTAEAVSVVQEGILDPVAAWIVDLDHQFRDRDLMARAYGEMGILAEIIDIPPLQNRHRYSFTWCGAEQAKLNVAMQQQGTALLNVARGMAQQLTQEGFQLRIAPGFERAFANVFGPQTARLMLVDQRHEQSMDPAIENQLLAEGHMVPVHKLDQDAKHLQSHMQIQQETGDPHGNVKIHIAAHLQQLQAKNAAQMQAQMAGRMGVGGAQGVPGGAGPGVAGTPRPPMGGAGMPQMGGAPAGPRLMRGPAGAIHPDQMNRAGGVLQMPRRF